MSRNNQWLAVRLIMLFILLLFSLRGSYVDESRSGRIDTALSKHKFNYVSWEINTLLAKFQQVLFGYHDYVAASDQKKVVIDYLVAVGELHTLEAELDATYTMPTADVEQVRRDLQVRIDTVRDRVYRLQPIAEPFIESQLSIVLRAIGFETAGQVLPPVKFRFVNPPDIMVVSPRRKIQQDFAISLRPASTEERETLEQAVEHASPDDSARVTGIAGVGIYPAMVEYTRWAAYAYEIVAHEWSHHYLFLFPSGQQYLATPEARIINETAATVFGNAVGVMVLERFYSEEVAQGFVWVPGYPTLDDFFPQVQPRITNVDSPNIIDRYLPDERDTVRQRVRTTTQYLRLLGLDKAAQKSLDVYESTLQNWNIRILPTAQPDRGRLINRTRLTADYLLQLDRLDAAEGYMAIQGQRLGIRRLNQAWFAFYGGYQADPAAGGGTDVTVTDVLDPNYRGDPIGPAIQEIFERVGSPHAFLVLMRDITTREALLNELRKLRDGA